MTELRDTVAKGKRAELCNEFIRPLLEQTRQGYLARIAEIAATELNSRKRAEKITALSVALKVVGNITNGLDAFIDAGDIAGRQLAKSEDIEKLGKEQRRIFDLVPGR